jgi:hypothetical protein
MLSSETFDRLLGAGAEVGERPDDELLGHVLGIGPHDPQHARRLEDRLVFRSLVRRYLLFQWRGRVAHAVMLSGSSACWSGKALDGLV